MSVEESGNREGQIPESGSTGVNDQIRNLSAAAAEVRFKTSVPETPKGSWWDEEPGFYTILKLDLKVYFQGDVRKHHQIAFQNTLQLLINRGFRLE